MAFCICLSAQLFLSLEFSGFLSLFVIVWLYSTVCLSVSVRRSNLSVSLPLLLLPTRLPDCLVSVCLPAWCLSVCLPDCLVSDCMYVCLEVSQSVFASVSPASCFSFLRLPRKILTGCHQHMHSKFVTP